MDRRPVPDHHKAGSDVSDQVLEKLDDVQAIQGLLTHQDIDPTGRSNTTHDREMVAGLPDAQDWRVTFGGVRPNSSRQKVKARFVHENQAPALSTGLGLKPWPDLCSPALDLLFVPLDGSCDRHLRRPAEFLQEPRDMAFVIGDAELLFDDLGDASTGPDLTHESRRLPPRERGKSGINRSAPAQAWGDGQESGCASNALGPSRRARAIHRLTDPSLTSSATAICRLAPADLVQLPGTHSPPLSPISWLETTRCHALL